MRIVEMEGPGGAWRVLIPETRRERMRGLRGHAPPGPHEAMLFLGCRSIHTFGMTGPISVAFLDGWMRVVEVRASRPGRLVVAWGRSRHVLEAAIGSRLRVGDRFSAGRATR